MTDGPYLSSEYRIMANPEPIPDPSMSQSGAAFGESSKALDRLKKRLLVLKAAEGDEGAFEALYRQHSKALLYFIRRIVRSVDAADDVSQQTWVAAFKGLRTLRDPDFFAGWIYGIAKLQSFQYLRKGSQLSDYEPYIEDLHEMSNEDELETLEKARDVHEALDRLKPREREILILKYMDDLSYEEISKVVSIRIGTVRSRLHNAKRAFQAMFGLSEKKK